MCVISQFRLAHAPTDPADLTAVLRELEARGVELGAHVTLWFCPACDFADATFSDPDEGL